MSKEAVNRGAELTIISSQQLPEGMRPLYKKREHSRSVLFEERDLLKRSFIAKNISSIDIFLFERLKTHAITHEGTVYRSFRSFRRKEGYPLKDDQFREVCKGLPRIPSESGKGKPIFLYPEEQVAARIKTWRKEKRVVLDPAIFATISDLAAIYNRSFDTVKRVLQDESPTLFGNTNHYRRREAGELLLANINAKQSNEGIYYREGRECIPMAYLNQSFGLSYSVLHARMEEVPGPAEEEGVKLYFLDEALEAISDHLEVPPVDRETGVYENNEGQIFAPARPAAEMLGISYDKLLTYCPGVQTEVVKARTGMITVGYNIGQLREKAKEYLSIPSISDLEKADETCVTIEPLQEEYELSRTTLIKLLAPIRIKTRGVGIKNHYPETAARKKVESFLQKPEVDKRTNHYVSQEGEIYISQTEAKRRLGILPKFIQRLDEHQGLTKLEGRSGGREMTLYRLSELEAGKQNPPPKKESTRVYPKINWVKEIEVEAQALVAAGVPLTRKGLRDNNAFVNRVAKHYRGGLTALQEKYDKSSLPPKKEVKPKRERIDLKGMTERQAAAQVPPRALGRGVMPPPGFVPGLRPEPCFRARGAPPPSDAS